MQRLLFFSGNTMVAYEWAGRRAVHRGTFSDDETGRQALQEWVAERPRTPVHLLIDLVEEEFHLDQVPHVIGRDRLDLHNRTLDKHFRTTPYRYIRHQRRLTEGRRDDEVLVAGITSPQLLRPWLDALDAAGAPLAGIYSLPLIGEQLVARLGWRSERILLVTQDADGALRQSYYAQGQLRFSRVVPQLNAELTPATASEVYQTRRFLHSQRLHPRGQPLAVVVIAADMDAAQLQAQFAPDDGISCYCFGAPAVARRLGLRAPLPVATADILFGHLLLRRWLQTNHYGSNRQRRHYFTGHARRALFAVAGLCLVAAAATGIAAHLRVEARQTAIAEAEARTRVFEQRYAERLAGLDEFDYRAPDVKEAVDLIDRIEFVARLGPEAAMARLGNVLAGHNRILLQRLDWRVTTERAGAAANERSLGSPGPILAASTQPDRLVEEVVLRGDVVGFDGIYRTAIETFQAFADDLRAADSVTDVEVVQAPFDLDPDTSVSGDSGTAASGEQPRRAAFVLRLRLPGGRDEPE